MALASWPSGVRGSGGSVLRDGYGYAPPDMVTVSEQAAGQKRRRRSTAAWERRRVRLRLPKAEFDLFDAFVAGNLLGGVLPFNWQPPERDAPARSRFVISEGRAFTMTPAPGGSRFVDFEIETIR